ncbi:MAG: penicillin-binding protein 2 [Verrucomicrobia bacterium]|nr:penicillin-binding protein 2 [Verrucomicrobiota bacterium]
MSRGFASSYRILLLGGGFLACFGALGARLVWLHVVDREERIKSVAKVRPMMVAEAARRGDILDARGARLATSRSEVVVGVDPHALLRRDEKKWPELAALLDMPEAELRERFTPRWREPAAPAAPVVAAPVMTPAGTEGGFQFNLTPAAPVSADRDEDDTDPEPAAPGPRPIRWVKLKEDVPESLHERIRKLNIQGVYGVREYRRVYPSNQLAAHLIGYVNREQKAVAGMEAYADFYLRGQRGWRLVERDGRNRELPQFGSREVPRVDGFSVTLSIDSTVQDIVEQELAYLAEKFEPLKASIVVSDPDGFILAMANYPTFNPNEFNKVPKAEEARMKNAAVADIYDPGSVFKIVPAAAALEERLVTPHTVIDCSLEKKLHNGRMLSLPGEDHRMGQLTVSEVISHSSNRGAAQLGMMLGEERLHRYARAFGFGSRLGFPVGGEVAGILHPWQKWYPIDITRIPMGHSVSATVLQMHQAMSVIATGGVLLRPQIIRQIRDAGNETVYAYQRAEIGRVISPETAARMAGMLVGVTRKGGTALEAAIEGFDVAGKTGTSQKFINGEWSRKHHIASFVGFFPAARPKVIISVIVDDADHRAPNGVAYGRTVAAPSFRRIGEQLIPILNIRSGGGSDRAGTIALSEGGRR